MVNTISCHRSEKRWEASASKAVGALTMGEFGWLVTVLFLIFGYFTPVAFSAISFIVWFSIVALLALAQTGGGISDTFSFFQWLCLCFLCFAAVWLAAFSEYGGGYALKLLVVILGVYFLVGVLGAKPPRCAASLFYGVSTAALMLMLAIWVLQPTFFAHFGGVDKTGDLAPLLYGALDKNWTAVFVFLYVAYSTKYRRKVGLALGLLYPLAYFGRQYLLMLAFLLVAISILRVGGGRFELKITATLRKPLAIFVLFIASGIIIAILSHVWVTYIIPRGIVAYKAGLNDGSNAIRMSSIDYVLDVISGDPSFIYRGYDQEIFSVLGINTDDFAATYYVGGLYRLVQPHNEVINMLVKEGLIFTLLYYGAVSNILAKYAETLFDVAITISFMLGCLFLHEMFTCQTLLLLVFVLASAGRERTYKKMVPSRDRVELG